MEFQQNIPNSHHVCLEGEGLELAGLKNARKLRQLKIMELKFNNFDAVFSSQAPHRFCYRLSYKYSYQCSPIEHIQRLNTSYTCTTAQPIPPLLGEI